MKGSDTTGNAVSFTTFHVLNDREIYNRLIKELDEMWPEKDMAVDHEVLEKLPYLVCTNIQTHLESLSLFISVLDCSDKRRSAYVTRLSVTLTSSGRSRFCHNWRYISTSWGALIPDCLLGLLD